MPTQYIKRTSTPGPGAGTGKAGAAPVYVDSDDDILKMIPAGSGTTEVQVIDASSTQTLTNKTVSGLVGAEAVEVVTTTNVITAAESGTTFFLNLAGGFTSTLPAPAAGLYYKFVVTTAPTTAYIITTNGGANVIEGSADVLSTRVAAANEDTINFVASTALVGDWVDVVSDGTSWFVRGDSGATGGITFTAT
jgi:hypothetical protein